jgi:Sigma-70 region 2
VSGFRQGVEAAIPALRRYARALTRETDVAEDLVQDTLMRALRSEHLFHGGDVRKWLYTIFEQVSAPFLPFHRDLTNADGSCISTLLGVSWRCIR